MGDILPNKPLVEAIFELRWALEESQGLQMDPNYTFLVGVYFEQLKEKFPYREELPAAHAPQEAVPYIAQYRFRSAKNSWPLIQLGPGLITVNDTVDYSWDGNFKSNCIFAFQAFMKSYPEVANLSIASVQLRYINALENDFDNESILDYCRKKLGVNFSLRDEIINNTSLKDKPNALNTSISYETIKPQGSITYRFSRGRHTDNDALIWEILVSSRFPNIDTVEIDDWLQNSHDVIESSFLAFSQGELLKEFKNE